MVRIEMSFDAEDGFLQSAPKKGPDARMRFSLHPVGVMLLLAVPLAACPQRRSGEPKAVLVDAKRAAAPASPHVAALVDRVRRKDFKAITQAGEIVARASPALAALASDPDPQVRALTLRCLDAAGGDRVALDAEVAGLLDPAIEVRIAAVEGLHHHATRTVLPGLLRALEQSGHPEVRREIARIIGRTEGADARELARRCEKERDPDAREGCAAALARLGDPRARAEFLRGLARARGRQRVDYLKQVEYIGQDWLLRSLVPLLADKTPAVRVGVEELKIGPAALRVCDVVVNLVAKISARPLPFPTGPRRTYTDTDIGAAQHWLEGSQPSTGDQSPRKPKPAK